VQVVEDADVAFSHSFNGIRKEGKSRKGGQALIGRQKGGKKENHHTRRKSADGGNDQNLRVMKNKEGGEIRSGSERGKNDCKSVKKKSGDIEKTGSSHSKACKKGLSRC